MRNFTFSKYFIVATGILSLSVIVFVCVMIAITREMSSADVLVTAISAQMSVLGSFYLNKSKRENLEKIGGLNELNALNAKNDADLFKSGVANYDGRDENV